jgi:hypothetical protein
MLLILTTCGLQYFFSFLAWLALGCVYAACVSFHPAYGELTDLEYNKVREDEPIVLACSNRSCVLLSR